MGSLDRSAVLKLTIELPVRNPDRLKTLAGAVSDPRSSQFRHFLTPTETTEQFGATLSDYRRVVQFARANGLKVTREFNNRLVLDVSATAATAEKVFHVRMNVYKRPDGTTFRAPDREPSINLSVPVLYIAGLENYAPPRRNATPVLVNGSGPQGLLIDRDIRAVYAPNDLSLTGSGQSVGLIELQGFNASDIGGYFNTVYPIRPANAKRPQILTWPSTNYLPPALLDETTLDIEMAFAMAPGLDSVVVYEGDTHDGALAAAQHPPNGFPLSLQLSDSWSVNSTPGTQQILDLMAAHGQSYFVSSGDAGAYCITQSSGLQPNTFLDNATSVGGTVYTQPPYNEIVWDSDDALHQGLFGPKGWGTDASGGGINPNVPIPYYQSGIANSANGASTTYRNYPDVAAFADFVFAFEDGTALRGLGTSASAPLWAGLVALVNQRRQQLFPGVVGMGFLNPILYEIGKSSAYAANFRDVTFGNNPGTDATCGSAPSSYPQQVLGYSAVVGYDLATGWGSPGPALISTLAYSPPCANGETWSPRIKRCLLSPSPPCPTSCVYGCLYNPPKIGGEQAIVTCKPFPSPNK